MMQHLEAAQSQVSNAAISGEAILLEFGSDRRVVRVRSADAPHQTGWAKVAFAGSSPGSLPGLGARVLIQELNGVAYMTAALDPAMVPEPSQLSLADGATVKTEHADDGERLTIRAPDGTLLVDYDASSSRLRIHATEGGVELDSGAADLNLRSDGTVAIHGKRLDLSGTQSVDVVSRGEANDGPGTSLRLGQRSARLQSQRLEVKNDQAKWSSERLEVEATTSQLKGDRAKLTADRVETVARTLVQKLGSAFVQADEVLQQRAGQFRQSVRDSFVMRCGRAVMRSKKKFKVDGESIHIG